MSLCNNQKVKRSNKKIVFFSLKIKFDELPVLRRKICDFSTQKVILVLEEKEFVVKM